MRVSGILKWLLEPREIVPHNLHQFFFAISIAFHCTIIYIIDRWVIKDFSGFDTLTIFMDRLFFILILTLFLYHRTCLKYYQWYDQFSFSMIVYSYTYIENKLSFSLSNGNNYSWYVIVIIIIISALLLLATSISYYNVFSRDTVDKITTLTLLIYHIWPMFFILLYLVLGSIVDKQDYFHLHHWIVGTFSLLLLFCSSRFVVVTSQLFLAFLLHGLISYSDVPDLWSP